tara:strand:- start:136 stop:372 length:237 start_codon:yes stop_codon:yes gene_type:complete
MSEETKNDTSRRLLQAVDKLEDFLRQQPQASSADAVGNATVDNSVLESLKQENDELKSNARQARQKLDILIAEVDKLS